MVLDANLNSGTLTTISSKIRLGNFNLQLWKSKGTSTEELLLFQNSSRFLPSPITSPTMPASHFTTTLSLHVHYLLHVHYHPSCYPLPHPEVEITVLDHLQQRTNAGAHMGADSSSLFSEEQITVPAAAW